MPRIPYTPQVDARTGRSNTPFIQNTATPNTFGAGVADALQGVSKGLGDVADVTGAIAVDQKNQQRKADLANQDAQSNYMMRELEVRNKVGPDGAGYQDEIKIDYQNWVLEQSDKIDDDAVRTAFKEKKLGELDGIMTRAAQWEMQMKAQHSEFEGNTSINAIKNKINQDPTQYDQYLQQGGAVIDALPNTTAGFRESMKQTFRYDSAKNRFDGMLRTAKTTGDLNNIMAELKGDTGRDWQKEFLPSDYQSLQNDIASSIKTFNTRADTDARATLTTIEERSQSGLIPEGELKDAQQIVSNSTDPIIQKRMARVVRDQEIVRSTQRLPPSEIRAQINATNGSPGMSYPGVPARVNAAVQAASEKTGISPALLGTMANKEYGQYLGKKKKDASAFAPTLMHAGLDARNVKPEMMEAVTVAGERIGSPLRLTKAGGGLAVSTIGMPEEEKATLSAALTEAGFTGFKQSENFIEVGDLLERSDGVDYGMPTAIKDEAGNPTSSAVGLYQFIDSTWLGLVKRPNVQAMLGVDVSKMTDAQILEWRKNPEVSAMVAGAYAMENKATLESALGRPINDAELYMAHFMGADGATTFLTAMKTEPSQSAADLMPKSAKANKRIFYDGDRKRSVGEVYGEISRGFSLAPSQVAYEDNKTREKVLKQAEAELAADPITHAVNVGSHQVTPITEQGGFEQRGQVSRAVADYYSIPISEMKPFTVDETAALKKQIDEGDADDNLQIMASIQRMGAEPSKAALLQLGEKDRVFAHAGDLYLEGMPGVAGDIIRGRKRLVENPSIEQQLGAGPQEINDAFAKASGGAFDSIEPARRQGMQDAAYALYVQKASERGKIGKFDKDLFSESVQAVAGGTDGDPSIASVNGQDTYLPRGINGDDMETAIDRMTIEDYTRMSAQGVPPRYRDGTAVQPYDIKDEVTLQSIGGGQYRLKLSDDTLLTTGKINSAGRVEWYIFKPDAEQIKKIAARPDRTRVSYADLNAGNIK